MEVIIKFNPDNPDDAMAYRRCVQSTDICIVLFEFLYNSRKAIEAELDDDPDADKYTALEKVYSNLHSLLQEYSINIDNLID